MSDSLNSIIGNQRAISSLKVAISAAKEENRLPGHILFSGPGGLGKTTLAKLVAKDIGGNFVRIHGPTINRKNIRELLMALLSLSPGDIFFIDEVHALPKEAMESLYEAMEEGQISIMVPDGNSDNQKPITIEMNPCLIIAATTQPNSLDESFKTRFVRHIVLEDYTVDELTQIIYNAASQRTCPLSVEESHDIACRSRGRARRALQLMNVVMDHIVTGNDRNQDIQAAFKGLGIGPIGDTIDDRKYLNVLADTLEGGPAGINAIVSASGLKKDDIENTIEPFLVRHNLIKKTARGRRVISTLSEPE